ncbi:MAG: glycoside hydrolase family 6 protein [Myxococcota bacterium]
MTAIVPFWLVAACTSAGGADSDTTSTDSADSGEGDGETGGGETGGGETGGGGQNPLAGLNFWVDPDSNAARESDPIFDKIADHPVAKWLGGWSGDVSSAVDDVFAQAGAATPVLVAYNIPNRDCGGYSAGGATTLEEYTTWVDDLAAGLAGRSAVVVLEPDSLALVSCLDDVELAERYAMLRYAAGELSAAGGLVYLDAGHSAWNSAADIADRLAQSGIEVAAGFTLNTSNFRETPEILAYGDSVSALLDGAHYVVDTSRNGLGPDGTEWCNPPGRALGEPPGVVTGSAYADAFLWIKAPGESDGSCNGGPSAGTWWADYARGLAERAAW